MRGRMQVEIDGHRYAMDAKSAIIVPPGSSYRATPAGNEPVSLIEVYGPAREDALHLVEYQHAEFREKGMAWDDNTRDPPSRGPAARPAVYRFDDIPRESRLFQGRMSRFGIRTRHAQVVFADIKPQPKAQQAFHRLPHDHPYDMMLVVLKGTMHVQMEGHDYDLKEGSVLLEPPYFMHRGYATGESITSCLEVYAPPRTDYLNLVEYQNETFEDGDDAWIKPELDSWNPPRL
jgi:mannose-6-phosphate isomerase-like protein (cupin superfamily)